MGISTRTFDQMVNAILDRIIAADIGITDKGDGTVIRTLVESIVAEIDIQNYTIDTVYNSKSIDDSSGEDLDDIVSILGVIRNPATSATGVVTFSRSTPAEYDIFIPTGMIVSTKVLDNNDVIEFAVTDVGKLLLTGSTSIDVNISAVNTGRTYIGSNQLIVMNDPPVGIELVTNTLPIDGGTDAEDDNSLRVRGKNALAGLGKGTLASLESEVKKVSGVIDAVVNDMARGVATADIIVVTSTMPVTPDMDENIKSVVADTKSAGVDVQGVYPTIKTVNISITTTPIDDHNATGNIIVDYFNTLGIGDTFIINQMESRILSAYPDIPVMDIVTLVPSDNVTATNLEVIRRGTITINGVEFDG